MLTGPHQISSLLPSSNTIRLSFGERPVFLPEKLINAPLDEMTAPSLRMASSYKEATGAFLCFVSPARYSLTMPVRCTHSDVDPVQVETGLRKVLQFLAQELVLFKFVVRAANHCDACTVGVGGAGICGWTCTAVDARSAGLDMSIDAVG